MSKLTKKKVAKAIVASAEKKPAPKPVEVAEAPPVEKTEPEKYPKKVNGVDLSKVGTKFFLVSTNLVDPRVKNREEHPATVRPAVIVGHYFDIGEETYDIIVDDGRLATLGTLYQEHEYAKDYFFSTEEGAKAGVKAREERYVLPMARIVVQLARGERKAASLKAGELKLATRLLGSTTAGAYSGVQKGVEDAIAADEADGHPLVNRLAKRYGDALKPEPKKEAPEVKAKKETAAA